MDDFGRYLGLVLGCYVAAIFFIGAAFGAVALWLLT